MDYATLTLASSGRINTPKFIWRRKHCRIRFTGSRKHDCNIWKVFRAKSIIPFSVVPARTFLVDPK